MREMFTKFNKFFIGVAFCAPGVAVAADTSFNMAAQLLSAARNGDTRLVQNLINSGADVNYVDSTGISVVCTAVMNNDTRAVQVLQMYGADASDCDKQIKKYKTRADTTSETGLFSGLSSTHKLVLGGVGTIAVIGGILWATDAFEGKNHNGSGGGGSGGNSDDNNNGGGNSVTVAFTLPYGPKMVDSSGMVSQNYNYSDELDVYSRGGFQYGFAKMNTYGNYLLMMHGYSPFARGYMGQSTLRSSSYLPVPPSVYGAKKLGTESVSGGIPINVALITANGVNAKDNTSLADRFFVWSSMSGSAVTDVNAASNTMISSKYFNNEVTLGSDNASIGDDTVAEATGFDFSGAGTAIHNTDATDSDNMLAKIVGGYTSGDSDGDLTNADTGDFVGFMPNGQMTVYRTGDGKNNLGGDINYYNYKALADAITNSVANETTDALTPKANYGRAKISVIANTDVIEPLYAANVKTVNDFIGESAADYKSNFYNWVGNYYNNAVSVSGSNTPAQDAENFFKTLGIRYFPLTVFSVGASETDSGYSGAYKYATFENAAPLAFNNIEGLFMSVVAVNLPNVLGASNVYQSGTASASNVSGFKPSAKYNLSQWQDQVANKYYKSRICGIAGTGFGSVDPWCFAAAGITDEQATAAAAGAAGAVKAAFSYLENSEIFALLALTADGAYLGTNPETGAVWTNIDDLVAYLSAMYTLPTEYQTMVDNSYISYLDAFKQVFGYGLINLERATMPGKSIYYYTKGKIVSTNGNAYWRSAQNTVGHISSVFGMRDAALPVSFYDILTDSDNTISVPRIWNAELSVNNNFGYGLYVGDTLAELKTRDVDNTVMMGNLRFGLARSERMYDDNMDGLDSLSVEYDSENFGLRSEYQHYLTDGMGRFTGLSNPVLSLVSNAVASRFDLRMGRFAIGGRGFVGNITYDGLLESDPVVSNNFAAAKLGDVVGAESGVEFNGKKLSLKSGIGTMHESNTVLGSMFGGALDLRGADTNYVDSVLSYNVSDNIAVTLRGTFAWTDVNDTSNGFINGVSGLKSNAFAAALRLGNFDISASMPLALTDGDLYYSYAEFALDDNKQVIVNNVAQYNLDLTPGVREYRFNASYKHQFGDWTDGALGFIYRINPNNTDAFGNESIFMMKLSHRLGI